MNIWDKQEDDLLATGDVWSADYSGGYTEIELIENVIHRQNNHWISNRTGERITNEEYRSRYPTYKTPKGKAVESFRFDILDFGNGD